MLNVVIEVVLAPALVGAATLAARRWGERTGGLVSAFPAIVGPGLLVTALEHGAAFAGRAASGALVEPRPRDPLPPPLRAGAAPPPLAREPRRRLGRRRSGRTGGEH